MNKHLSILIVFFIAINSIAQNDNNLIKSNAYPDKIMFQLKEEANNFLIDDNFNIPSMNFAFDDQFMEKYDVTALRRPFFSFTEDAYLMRVYTIHFSNTERIDELVLELSTNSRIEFASKMPIPIAAYSPNDTKYLDGDQYHIDLIKADDAWDITEGDTTVVVGIPDIAFEVNHPDLIGKIQLNDSEIDGDGIDNDSNGYTDDIYGWSPQHLIGDSTHLLPTPNSQKHGTKVTGIVVAHTNNGFGVASVGNKVKYIPVDIGTDGGSSIGYADDGLNYLYARRFEIDVINCSWGASYIGFEQLIPAYQNVINNFVNSNILIVGSAGNEGNTNVYYPGNLDNAVSVAATKANDEKLGSSNYHETDIIISAPGESFSSTKPGNGYGNFAETSAAAPIISAVCALMRSVHPTISIQDMISCLQSSADPALGLYADSLGAGRVNALEAVLCAQSLLSAGLTDESTGEGINIYPNPSEDGTVFISLNNSMNQNLSIEVYNNLGQLVNATTVQQDNQLIQLDLSSLSNGTYLLSIKDEQQIHTKLISLF